MKTGICLPVLLVGTFLLAEGSPASRNLGADIHVTRLGPGIWCVTSVSELTGFGRVSSNAMLITTRTGSVLIDVPATTTQTRAVLDWADKVLKSPVQAVICTHSHVDRLGGLSAAHDRGITSYGLPLTQRLAGASGLPCPQESLAQDQALGFGGQEIHILFPGAGHSPDNLVVWVPSSQVLFGGCLIKERESQGIGNRTDIDPAAWMKSLAQVQARFQDVRIVVPGHGRPGGIDLISHTRRLLAALSRE